MRRGFRPVHDRGTVLVSAACAVLLGARSMAGIDVMRQASLVLGRPASASTLWRTLEAIGPVQLTKIASARARTRVHVHQQLDLRPGGFPWIKVNGRELTGVTVLDLDASVIPAHSDKEGAEPNFKGYGHHPLLMFCDNTEELLVNRLRPGSAGSNTADDHISVSIEGLRQLPTRRRRRVLFRTDGAGATREFLAWITSGGGNARQPLGVLRRPHPRRRLLESPGQGPRHRVDPGPGRARDKPRKDADLVEITDMLDLTGWPEGMRVIVRREPVHPKYERELKPYEKKTDYRYQAIATNTTRRATAVPRRPSPLPHPRRGRHPTRQGPLPQPDALPLLQGQPSLVHPPRPGHRPRPLVPTPGHRRQTRPGRARHPAHPAPGRPRETRRPRPKTRAETRPRLARIHRHRRRLGRRPGPARPRLTAPPHPPRSRKEETRPILGPWKPTTTRDDTRAGTSPPPEGRTRTNPQPRPITSAGART